MLRSLLRRPFSLTNWWARNHDWNLTGITVYQIFGQCLRVSVCVGQTLEQSGKKSKNGLMRRYEWDIWFITHLGVMYSSSSSSRFLVIVAMANGLCGAAYARSSSTSSLHWQYAVDTCVNTFKCLISTANFRMRCVPSVFILTAPAIVWSNRTFAAQWNTTFVSAINRLRSDSLMPKPSIEISPLITMIFFNCCGFVARMRSKICECKQKNRNQAVYHKLSNVKVFYCMHAASHSALTMWFT